MSQDHLSRREVGVAKGSEPVVGILGEEWAAIAGLGSDLAVDEWALPSECPGWSVRDLLSHIVGTERTLLGDAAPKPPAETPKHVRNAIGAINEAWVDARRRLPGSEVLAEFLEVTSRRVDQMRSWPSERFDELGPSPVGRVPYGEFMHVRAMDCWIHEQDMRVATGRPGHKDCEAARVALDRFVSAMGFVVGKQAAAPEGASVRFDVTGDLARRVDLEVKDGRAVQARIGGTPTATLKMDLEAFWRLSCGRVDGSAAIAARLVILEGDDVLAKRVVESMAFMI